MTTPSSGPIAFSDLNSELGRAATAQLSIDDSAIRTLIGIPSGAIDINSGHGKTNRIAIAVTISTSTNNYVAATSAASGYIAGKSDVTFTINSGVVIGSSSTGTYAFVIDSSWNASDTVTVVNNGSVIGKGGQGGAGANGLSGGGNTVGGAGLSGGPAVLALRATVWTNTGLVGGGGGGGGGGGSFSSFNSITYQTAGGGGGGGGFGGGGFGGGGTGNSAGSAGSAGSNTFQGLGGLAGSLSNSGGTAVGQNGGNGGALGTAGSAATGGSGPDGQGSSGGVGAAGACLTGKTFVNSGAGITGGTIGGTQS